MSILCGSARQLEHRAQPSPKRLTFFTSNSIEVARRESTRESSMQPPSPLLINDLLLPERFELIGVLALALARIGE